LLQYRLLRQAVRADALQTSSPLEADTDWDALTARLASAVRQLLHDGIDLAALAEHPQAGERSRRVARLAQLYTHFLNRPRANQLGYLDPAQVLWQAAQRLTAQQLASQNLTAQNLTSQQLTADDRPLRRPVALWGYGLPSVAEVAWGTAIAGEGSRWWLDASATEAIQALTADGWQWVGDPAIARPPSAAIPTDPQTPNRDLHPNSHYQDRDPHHDPRSQNRDRLRDPSPHDRDPHAIPNIISVNGTPANGTPANGTPIMPVVHGFANRDAEVRWVLGQVKDLLARGVSPREVAIVARDERGYGQRLLDVAWELETPVRVLYEVPLGVTRLGAWTLQLLDLVGDRFPFEDTVTWLSHPLSRDVVDWLYRDRNPELDDPEGDRAQSWWVQARKARPETIADWQTIGLDLAKLQQPSGRSRSDLAGWLSDILRRGQVRRQAARLGAREAVAFQVLERAIVDVERWQADEEGEEIPQSGKSAKSPKSPKSPKSQRLGRSPRRQKSAFPWAEFTAELRQLLNLLTVPAEPRRTGVELHQPKAIAGARYRYLFAVGLTEGVFPATIHDDPVLDFWERKQLARAGFRLEGAADLARRERVHFQTLCHSATESLILTYPQAHGSEVALPSGFLTGLPPATDPPIAPITSAEMALRSLGPSTPWPQRWQAIPTPDSLPILHRDRPPLTLTRLQTQRDRVIQTWQVERSRESILPPDHYDGEVGIGLDPASRVFSASQLTDFGQCGFRWFAARLLRLKELSEPETQFAGSLRGSFYHEVLEMLLKPCLGKTVDAALITDCHDRLDAAIAEVAERRRLGRFPTWPAKQAEERQVLRSLLNTQDFWPSEGGAIFACEAEFTGEWEGLRVTGKVDRVDRSPDGLTMIDYKTSKHVNKAQNRHGELRLDVQLPLYATVAAPQLVPDLDPNAPVQPRYYNVRKAQPIKPSQSEDADPTDLSQLAAQVRDRLAQGSYAVAPDRDQKACTFCDAALVCRRGDRLSRKPARDAI
jgi:RecB family exonuclease